MQRIALVTGGSSAIGAQICRTLTADGFWVGIGYHAAADKAAALADELTQAGGRACALPCDVCDPHSMATAKADMEGAYGIVDTLVCCAGVEDYRLLTDESEEGIAETLQVNLRGVISACRIFVPAMITRRFGRIVPISSVWGVCGAAMETVYSAAKAGVIGFAKALAAELAPSSVTVNTVSPGFIDTPMNGRFTPAERAAIAEEIPAGRFGTPQDVANAVRFFVSAESSYVTGQNLVVGGGYKNI